MISRRAIALMVGMASAVAVLLVIALGNMIK